MYYMCIYICIYIYTYIYGHISLSWFEMALWFQFGGTRGMFPWQFNTRSIDIELVVHSPDNRFGLVKSPRCFFGDPCCKLGDEDLRTVRLVWIRQLFGRIAALEIPKSARTSMIDQFKVDLLFQLSQLARDIPNHSNVRSPNPVEIQLGTSNIKHPMTRMLSQVPTSTY